MVVMPQIFTRAVVEENVEENTAKLSLNYCEILTARSLFLRNKKAAPVRERLGIIKIVVRIQKAQCPLAVLPEITTTKPTFLIVFSLGGLVGFLFGIHFCVSAFEAAVMMSL